MTWRIVYIDGTEEFTPEEIDLVTTGVRAPREFLYCYRRNSYGPNELIRTYPLASVKYWEKVK